MKPMTAKPISVAWEILMYSLRSGLLQRLTRRTESIMKACRGSLTLRAASIVGADCWLGVERRARGGVTALCADDGGVSDGRDLLT